MNMARCMIFACGLPLRFWGDAVQYAAYILNRAPTNSNPGRASPLKVLTGKSPPLGEIVVFGSPCTVYRDPRKKNFAQRAQTAMIVGVGEETKGYRVYLPKDRVVTTHHVKNIETLDKEQNLQVQRLYLQGDETLEGDEAPVSEAQASVAEATSARSKKKRASSKKKKPWARERHVTRSVAKNAGGMTNETAQSQEAARDIVNSVTEHDPKTYQEAMRTKLKDKWLAAMAEELRALEDNGVWRVVRKLKDAHALHTKWVYKTKMDAEGAIERLKARLVACGNEQEFGVDYSVTFSAVIEMSSVKLVFVLARKWRVPAKHGDVPNAYVKADKEAELDIFLHLPRGMMIPEDVRRRLGVDNDSELVLELLKALYSLKQAGRLWNQLLHKTLIKLGFAQSLTDMCVYHRRREGILVVVGVYVDDLLVTGMEQQAVDAFFGELTELSIKDLGPASKFLGMRVSYDEDEGYDLDHELTIEEMLREHGMASVHSVRTPIGAESNEIDEASDELLPTSEGDGVVTVRKFQSLMGSLMWVERCTRPDIAYAVHKASRRTHSPTMSDWKLGKRIARYLAGTKSLRLSMNGQRASEEPLKVIAYSDADFAADKADRKSVTGGLLTVDGMPVSWVCKKQTGVSLSTMEAEHTAASVMATELLGVRELLGKLGITHASPMSLRVDNQAALKQLDGEGSSSKAKHIDVRIKFVGGLAKRGVLKAEYLESEKMPADVLTKALDAPRLADLRVIVGLH
ncbi:hypothetical protein PF008_g25829 [Phytophthora fragariae]|uniref:Uncharacterized protein n=1 Tax=Phytophthora fragariae TaxID=53985 RepID=A0A6G0QJF5_9STRA|nr:hypothetical protein PF008_g25829 [Phytophthora fragariae]